MCRELIAQAPCQTVFRTYSDESPLKPHEVRVRTLYGSPKHGTELNMYRGTNPFQDKEYDSEWQMFRTVDDHTSPFPFPLGNMFVGEVVAAGSEVTGLKVSDRVAGYGPLRETQTVSADQVLLMPANMPWQAAVCYDPAQFALQGLRDSHLRLGDTTVVFGLGAIGLITVAMAKLAGAHMVAAVDPIAIRRRAALDLGADVALDPLGCDIGSELRKETSKRGVDCAIETSGTASALHQAIRSTAFGGRVTLVGWYNHQLQGLNLGEEAHFNIPDLIFSRAASEPSRDHPRWNRGRIKEVCWDLLAARKIDCEKIIFPIVTFDELSSAYDYYLNQHPEQSIKLGVEFESSVGEDHYD